MSDADKLPSCPTCGKRKCKKLLTAPKTLPTSVKVVGSGDTTTVVNGDDGQPYRFKTGTEREQRQELQRELDRQEASVPERFRRKHDVY